MKHLQSGAIVALFLLCVYVPVGFSQTLPWSSLTNPSGPLTLSMGTNATTFNATTAVFNLNTTTPLADFMVWANTTSATSTMNQDSPLIDLCGMYWQLPMGPSKPDCWKIQNSMSTGLTLTHTGQGYYGGAAGLTLDSSMNTLTMYGQLAIDTSPTAASGFLPNQAFIAMQEGNTVGLALGNNSFIGAFTTNGGATGPFNGMGLSHNGNNWAPIANAPISPTAKDCANYTGTMNPVLGDAGGPCTPTLYSAQSSAVSGNISSVPMLTASATHDYLLTWTVSLTAVGASCTGSTTVTLNTIFTDPNASLGTVESLGTLTLANLGNGVKGFIASGTANILAKASTNVSYSTSNYTAGTGCVTNPTYQVSPSLVQVW